MPRNSSGTYSLPAGNPVTANTLIQAAWANPTMSDLGAAITDSLDRYGRGTMLAALKVADGLVSAPGLAFGSEASTGIYRTSAGTINLGILGVLVATFASAGVTFATPATFNGAATFSQPATFNAATTFTQPVTLTGAGLTLGGQLLVAAGTVGAPGAAFVGDTNNGWWAPAADVQAWSTVGVERMRLDASGNLNVGSATNDFGGVIFGKKSAGVASVDVFAASTSEAKLQLLNINNSAAIGNGAGGELRFYAADRNVERMRIDTSGNVGVGTTSPSAYGAGYAALSVNGTTGGVFDSLVGGTRIGTFFATATEVRLASQTAVPLTLYTSGSERVRIDASGNVGINGAANGAVSLHVNPGGGLNRAGLHIGDLATGISFWESTGNDPAIIYGSASVLRFGTQTGIGAAGFVERMRIDSGGNALIGTAASAQGTLTVDTSKGVTGVVFGDIGSFANNTQLYMRTSGLAKFLNVAGGAFTWGVSGGSEWMRIDGSGNVGIGTGNPSGFGNTGKFAVLTASSTGGVVATFANSGSTGAAIQLFQSGVDTATIGMPAGVGGVTFLTGTNERMRIDASGNVGIGKTPAYKFDVSGGAHAQALTANGTADAYETAGGTATYYNGAGNGVLRSYANSSGTGNSTLAFWTTGSERMRLDAAGSLLIGATGNDFGGVIEAAKASGNATIDVFAGSAAEAKLQLLNINNSAAIGCGTGGGELRFYAADRNTERMRIDGSGNVGIGSAPTYQLDVRPAVGSPVLRVLSNAGADAYVQANSNVDVRFGSLSNYPVLFMTNGAERLRITSDGRLYGTALHNNAGAVTGTANQYIASGTYTPTLTNTGNITSSSSLQAQWIRVGNVVSVSGQATVTPTTTASIVLGVSLPIGSDITAAQNLEGTGALGSGAVSCSCTGDATNDRATISGTPTSSGSSQTLHYHFQYLIQ